MSLGLLRGDGASRDVTGLKKRGGSSSLTSLSSTLFVPKVSSSLEGFSGVERGLE